MKILKAVLITAALVLSGNANAEPITSLTITGGSFSLNGGTPDSFVMGDFANMTVGGYDGSAPTSADFLTFGIANFEFSAFGTVIVYTSPADGARSGFNAPTGDITGGVATLELDSWTAWWSGTVFNQGSTSTKGATETCQTSNFVTKCSTPVVVNSYNPVTGAFTASWDSVVVGGAFNGQLGNWTIEGAIFTGGELPFIVGLNVDGGLTHECSSVDGSVVYMTANIQAPNDKTIESINWNVNGVDVGIESSLEAQLPLGINDVNVSATLSDGAMKSDSVQIVVEDTTFPDFSIHFVDQRSDVDITEVTGSGAHYVSVRYDIADTCDSAPVKLGGTVVPVHKINDGDLMLIELQKLNSTTLNTSALKVSGRVVDASGNSASDNAVLSILDN